MTATTGRGARPEHLATLAANRFAVMATVHPDGRPQLSLVQQHCADGVSTVSLTGHRVKTRNLRSDDRVTLLVLPDGVDRFVVAEGRARLSDVSTAPGDEVGQALSIHYEALVGPHPDREEYHQAMVDDERLLCTITIEHTYEGGT